MNALTGNVPSSGGNPVRDGRPVEKRAPPVFPRSGNPVRDDILVEDISVECISRQGNHINRKTCAGTQTKTPYGVSRDESPTEISGCLPQLISIAMNALTGNIPSSGGNPGRDGRSVEKRAPPVFPRSGNPVRDDILVEDISVECISRQGNHINRKTCTDTRIKTPYGVSHDESPTGRLADVFRIDFYCYECPHGQYPAHSYRVTRTSLIE
jgi:hypothetical protein